MDIKINFYNKKHIEKLYLKLFYIVYKRMLYEMDTGIYEITSIMQDDNEFKEFLIICDWFKTNSDSLILNNKASYYPRLRDTDKRGFSALKEICDAICFDKDIVISKATILNYLPILKNHYTMQRNDDGLVSILEYSLQASQRLFDNHQSIVVNPYNPVVIEEVENDFLHLFKELVDIEEENLTREDMKTLISYLVDKL